MNNTYIFPYHIHVRNMNAQTGDFLCGVPSLVTQVGFLEALRRKLLFGGLNGITLCYHSIDLQSSVFFSNHTPMLIKGTHDSRGAKLDAGVSIQPHCLMHVDATLFLRVLVDKKEMKVLFHRVQEALLNMRLGGGNIFLPENSPILTPWCVGEGTSRELAKVDYGHFFIEVPNKLQQRLSLLQKFSPEATRVTTLIQFLYHFKKFSDLQEQLVNESPEDIPFLQAMMQNTNYYVMSTGYASVGPCHEAGSVACARDMTVPVQAVERVYSLCQAIPVTEIFRDRDFLNCFFKAATFQDGNRTVYVAKPLAFNS